MPDTLLILNVKGTDQHTSLPKAVVRAGIAQGQITRSQLIWSPDENSWKQVRELPHLLPSQKLAPSPTPRGLTGAVPKVVRASGTLPKVALTQPTPRPVVKVAGAVPRVAVPVARAPIPLEVVEEKGFDYVKWVFIGLGIVIAGLIGVNLFIVELPLYHGLHQTDFSGQPVYAHLGAFVQPNALIIHLPGAGVKPDQVVDFLAAVAKSTPEAPFGQGAFERVSLARGMFGDYSISGFAWKKLGDMTTETADEKKDFLLDQLATNSGAPLVQPNSNFNPDQQAAEREKIWNSFVATFTR